MARKKKKSNIVNAELIERTRPAVVVSGGDNTARRKLMRSVSEKNEFQPEYIHQAYLLALKHNYTNSQLAEQFGVSGCVFATWWHLYPDLQESVLKGRDYHALNELEPSLVKRATGYEYQESKTEEDADGNQRVTVFKKVQAPDTNALKFILTNRMPARWKPEKNLEHKADVKSVGAEIDLARLSNAELADLRHLLEKSTSGHADAENQVIDTVLSIPAPRKDAELTDSLAT